ncbi:hypothetical protein JCM19232_3289 [Vibrio ishigakensis]|uniref:Uncharacterized protein n=1 Tax=Vibrio ishigakensis TaxID=1481914 RepID=A0A0B8PLK9_9VIBR|nr:hypothetical protein JCM19232_3289 [Vibrio ishigakensis]
MASRRKYLPVGLVSASLPQTLALHHSLPLKRPDIGDDFEPCEVGAPTDAAAGE